MSAWYIFGALGFYPVNPVSGDYVIGSYVLFSFFLLSLYVTEATWPDLSLTPSPSVYLTPQDR